MDKDLLMYERKFIDPDLEKYLITKNELLTSFGISKAETSKLTLNEANGLYKMINIGKKMPTDKKYTQKEHDKLEFYNIAKTFKELNTTIFKLDDFTLEFVLEIHKNITGNLDAFNKHISNFTLYKPGKWRDNDDIRVGEYAPAPYSQIKKGVTELLQWIIKNPTPVNIAVFHTALYSLHPFNNGNKRVCRVLEHLLLRAIGLNQKNLYSPSYYFHIEKQRYYKYMAYSLYKKNLNYFSSFVLESYILSIISVYLNGLLQKRTEFIKNKELNKDMLKLLKPLIAKKEIQFKNLYRYSKNKMARQTFVDKLQELSANKILFKREQGRNVYYSLNCIFPEEQTIKERIKLIKSKLSYIPDTFTLAVF